MDPAVFRRDPFLRSSAYHLATWSLVGFVLERTRVSPSSAGTSSRAFVATLVAASLLTSITHERRVGKIAGPAGDAIFAAAGRMWMGLLALLVAASVALGATGEGQWLFTLWMLIVGGGLAAWGVAAEFRWYLWMGAALVLSAAADLALRSAGQDPGWFRGLVLAAAIPAAAIATNRRFLWFRPPRG